MRKITLTIVLSITFTIFYTPKISAQEFLEHLPSEKEKHTDFFDMRKAFEKWVSEHPNPDKLKGTKRFKRWEWLNSTRLLPDGTAPSPAVRLQGIREAQEMRRLESRMRTNGSAWSPVGPMEYAEPTADETSGHNTGRLNCIAFDPTNPDILWAGSSQGGVWRSDNHGESWQPMNEGLPTLRISDIAVDPNNPQTLYVCTGDYGYLTFDVVLQGRATNYGFGIYKSTDGGNSWQATGIVDQLGSFDNSLMRRTFIDPANSDNLLAAGVSGIWSSDNGGDTWSLWAPPTQDLIIWDIEQDMNNPNTFYATSGYMRSKEAGRAAILKSENFGKTWRILNTGIPEVDEVQRIEVCTAPSNSDYVYALTCGINEGFYALYRSVDAGETWEERSSVEAGDPNILGWFNGDPFFGDEGGQGTYDLAIIVDPENEERIFTGGVNMWGSEDGGETWDIVSFWVYVFGESVHADQHQFKYNPANQTYYVCNDGGLYTTQDIQLGSLDEAAACVDITTFEIRQDCYELPTVWKNISGGLNITEFYRIGLSQDNEDFIMAGSQDNGTFYKLPDRWAHAFGGDGMECMIRPDNPEFIYATNPGGALSSSEDGGVNWEFGLEEDIINEEEGIWVTPYEMHPEDPSTLFAGFRNLWRSNDAGKSWRRLSDFPAIPSGNFVNFTWDFEVSPSHPSVIYVAKAFLPRAGANAELWRSGDDGITWVDMSEGLPVNQAFINYIAVDTNDPDRLWVVFGGFIEGEKVYESSDGGLTWLNISEGLPNVPVNTIVNQSGKSDYLYIGTDVGIFYRNNSSGTWQAYNENLPLVIISELETHEKTGKLYAGTYGRGVWMADLFEDEADDGVEDPDEVTSTDAFDFYQTQVSLFPNPATDRLTLHIENLQSTNDLRFELADIMGRTIRDEMFKVSESSFSQSVDIADLKTGLYFIRLSSGNKTIVRRFVKE